ncbi:hypothetical protein CEXT_80911 [Caerostris extrusa]|uniref:Uncharacterized protein n=1 Tax=Caerostris extrusa TaxID=172846 RepID=A0AAV4M426_CAEEX|nr:hypothetical protein CEXT_80911 [Caerostris extrusa]
MTTFSSFHSTPHPHACNDQWAGQEAAASVVALALRLHPLSPSRNHGNDTPDAKLCRHLGPSNERKPTCAHHPAISSIHPFLTAVTKEKMIKKKRNKRKRIEERKNKQIKRIEDLAHVEDEDIFKLCIHSTPSPSLLAMISGQDMVVRDGGTARGGVT